MRAKGREADIALTCGTKTDTWRTNDVGTMEQGLEEFPRIHAVGSTHPDVGRVLATVALVAEGTQRFQHMGGILHIIVDGSLDLSLALGRVDGLCGTLADVAGAVELGALAATPQLVQGHG